MMIRKTVEVRQYVEVVVDETKLDDEFQKEFREDFYPFQGIDDHIRHIAQLKARNLIVADRFIEGYGILDDMGISAKIIAQDDDILD